MQSIAQILIGRSLIQPPLELVDLKDHKFTKAEKLWVVNEIMCRRVKTKSFAETHNLRANTLSKWVHAVRNNIELGSTYGRQRCLDETSVGKVSEFIAEVYGLGEPGEKAVEFQVTEEFVKTFSRRYPKRYHHCLEDGEEPTISRRSLKRYVNEFVHNIPITAPTVPIQRDVIVQLSPEIFDIDFFDDI